MNQFQKLLKDIHELRIQGATNITLAALRFLKGYVETHGFDKKFFKICEVLKRTRNTQVMLYNALNIIEKEKSIESIEVLIEKIKEGEKLVIRNARKVLKKGKTIMTHCHSTLAVRVINAVKPRFVYVTETRPNMQGLLTYREIKASKALIIDAAFAYFLDDVDYLVFGTDALRKEGVVNKIGTLPMCIVAKEYKKPVYIVATSLKIDKRESIEIECRSPKEIANVKHALNPVFDITPYNYISKVITEKRIYGAKEIAKVFG